MHFVIYGFSVHHFISSVGADAGFAAIIGLAILVLLYFAQARETASLREQAFQSAQRVQQLEARLVQLSRMRADPATAGPQPAPAPSGFPRPVTNPLPANAGATSPALAAGEASLPAAPAAPAGVAAPALTAATRLIPIPTHAPASVATPAPRPAAATAAAQRSIAEPGLGAPAPAGANGSARDSLENGAASGPAAPVGVQPPPRVQVRPDAVGAKGRRLPGPSRGLLSQPPHRRGPAARAFAVLLAALAVGGAVALLLVLTSSGGKQQSGPRSTSNSNAALSHRTSRAIAFTPASVTLAVLNGTATAGLAANFSHQLGRDGYKIGATTNAADQTHTSTIVAYLQGQKAAALHVALSLGLGVTSVQPIDQTTHAIACPPPSPCADEVVVTLGSDLASRA